MKKILVFSTLKDDQPILARALGELSGQGFYFSVKAKSGFMIPGSNDYGRPWLPAGSFSLGVLWPLWYLLYFFALLGRTLVSKPDALACCSWPEQTILSPLAALFGWRVIWFRIPGTVQEPRGWLLRKLQAAAAKRAEIVTFSGEVRQQLEEKGIGKRWHLLRPAVRPQDAPHQQDMFQTMAGRREHRFVIGAMVENLDRLHMERLLSALTIALTVSPAFELVIVGEGEQRKPLQWLIRKMNLSSHVWLAGSNIAPARWLEHVDVYAMPHDRPGLEEIANAIVAMNYGLPVLASDKAGLGDIITAKVGALVDMGDAETVARQFRRLEQAGDLRKTLGAEAQREAENLTFERFVGDLRVILEGRDLCD